MVFGFIECSSKLSVFDWHVGGFLRLGRLTMRQVQVVLEQLFIRPDFLHENVADLVCKSVNNLLQLFVLQEVERPSSPVVLNNKRQILLLTLITL